MLVRRSPLVAELRAIQQELAGLLDRVFGFEGPGSEGFVPALDVYFQDGHCVVRADLAGVDPKAVEILLHGNVLTIRGERKAPEVARDDVLLRGIPYGRFERTVTLPEGLDVDGVKAQWLDGILEIRIPVEQELRPRKIPVEIAA
ncbi:MAG: Hsp20/alpha crystallin family protein [Armatimonadota bacterium]|nr:Hsp20/alpha crystallin family protein [Armatimonadota bacterium]MDR7444384.1 Hsp20/alpha crystallin family protein [Armatimonadota bacterium]MDR7570741.1 Hsp20/alpha crystallin family protein [Armatimonadota bacterium]MDR7614871.1 Hsp20/alpha crystallin family protein [Armatimonadota bacterium]